MNMHQHARLTPAGRALLVRRVLHEGVRVPEAAEMAGVSTRTGYKWLRRFKDEGEAGLLDRSSRPHRSPRQTPPGVVARMLELRRKRLTGPSIARRVGRCCATVARHLLRAGMSRLKCLEPKEPARRYERERPGELLHVDVKKLGRIRGYGHRVSGKTAGMHRARHVGWDFVHVCVDDHSRLAYVEVLPDERSETSVRFLRRAVAWLKRKRVRVEEVMTDNAPAYLSHLWSQTCEELGLRPRRTRPYRPRTNGKAERFIQSLLRECAYRTPYVSSRNRRRGLSRWVRRYNYRRPHASLGGRPPISRLSPVR